MAKDISDIVHQNKEVVCYLVESIVRRNGASQFDVPDAVLEVLKDNAWKIIPEQAGVYRISLHDKGDDFEGRIVVQPIKEKDKKKHNRIDMVKIFKRIKQGLFFEILFYAGGTALCQIYPEKHGYADDEVDQLFAEIGITVGKTKYEQALIFADKINEYQKG